MTDGGCKRPGYGLRARRTEREALWDACVLCRSALQSSARDDARRSTGGVSRSGPLAAPLGDLGPAEGPVGGTDEALVGVP